MCPPSLPQAEGGCWGRGRAGAGSATVAACRVARLGVLAGTQGCGYVWYLAARSSDLSQEAACRKRVGIEHGLEPQAFESTCKYHPTTPPRAFAPLPKPLNLLPTNGPAPPSATDPQGLKLSLGTSSSGTASVELPHLMPGLTWSLQASSAHKTGLQGPCVCEMQGEGLKMAPRAALEFHPGARRLLFQDQLGFLMTFAFLCLTALWGKMRIWPAAPWC